MAERMTTRSERPNVELCGMRGGIPDPFVACSRCTAPEACEWLDACAWAERIEMRDDEAIPSPDKELEWELPDNDYCGLCSDPKACEAAWKCAVACGDKAP